MPRSDRMHQMMREVVEAALDQRKPSKALQRALNRWLDANEHRVRLQREVVGETPSTLE